MQNSRIPMMIAITQNIVNILASLCFVFGLNMKIEGVALGTMIAQYAGFLMAFSLWYTRYAEFRRRISWEGVFEKGALIRFFQVNRDIFFRTICLVAVTVYFTSAGSAQGEVILAVNTLLMQLFTLFSYFMDGFAYAGEALTGRFIGAEDKESLKHTIRDLFRWGVALSALFTVIYAIGGVPFLRLMTDDVMVQNAAAPYFYWVLAIPFAGFAAFLYDGIFIGATATRMMFHSMLVATFSFFFLFFAFRGMLGNHALWMAFIIYLILRGVMQGWLGRKIIS